MVADLRDTAHTLYGSLRVNEDIYFLSALDLGDLLQKRELSAVELTEEFIKRIDELNPVIASYITPTPDVAREHAKAAEARLVAGEALSPFDGVPVSIKDLSLTAGIRTTLGSKAFEEFVPPINTYYVDRILNAGMVLLGKTNAPEFGCFPVGENLIAPPSRNPWNIERSTGGSSAGAAAAVSAGLCPIAEGSDGGGSIRIPSAANGVIGIKPSRGRVSHGPLLGETPMGLSTSGPIARSVSDAAAFLDLMSGPHPGDPAPAPPPSEPFLKAVEREAGKLRIGYFTKDVIGEASPEMKGVVEGFAKELAGMGHKVEEMSVDHVPNIQEPFLVVWRVSMAFLPISDLDLLDPCVRPLAEAGRKVTATEFLQAEGELTLWLRNFLAPIYETYDVVLAPILTDSPPPIGYIREDPETAIQRAVDWMHWCPTVNVSGMPAIALPVATGSDGMPIGVQLIGPRWSEEMLISLGAEIERARGGLVSRPPIT